MTILNEWGCAELIVTFGQLANEESFQEYQAYQNASSEARAKVKKPPKEYIMKFMTIDDILDVNKDGGK